jgi:hypothetical protein
MSDQQSPGATPEQLQAYLRKCRRLIEDHGHMVQTVFPTAKTPALVYTVGLSLKQQPELVVIGLPPHIATAFLNQVADRIQRDPSLLHKDIPGVATTALRLREVPVTAAVKHCLLFRPLLPNPPGRVFQLIWPDVQGHFPGDAEYRHLIAQTFDELNPREAH